MATGQSRLVVEWPRRPKSYENGPQLVFGGRNGRLAGTIGQRNRIRDLARNHVQHLHMLFTIFEEGRMKTSGNRTLCQRGGTHLVVALWRDLTYDQPPQGRPR
jgi:hypothetical protein